MEKLALNAEQDLPVSPAPEQIERRGMARVTVMIRPGKLIADGREFLCVVRDVSETGLKIRLFHRLPEHRSLAIEFDNGERHALQLVWQTDDQAGCFFIDTVDCSRLLAGGSEEFPRRQPRINITIPAVIYAGGLRSDVQICDISQRGASIDTPAWLMIDELVRVECPLLPTLHAKVRWRRPPRYGLVFEQTFRIEELAQACAKLQMREG